MKYCYVAIGNTDNKLTQVEWSNFIRFMRAIIDHHAQKIHMEGHSLADKPWQNACWGFDIEDEDITDTQEQLQLLAGIFKQDTIAWSNTETFFLAAK